MINSGAYKGYTYGTTSYTAAHGQRENNYIEEARMVSEIVNKKLRQYVIDEEKAIEKKIEEYGAQVWTQLIDSLIPVLTTDIDSVVAIGFEGAKDVFTDKKTQKYISDHIKQAAIKELQKIKNAKVDIRL